MPKEADGAVGELGLYRAFRQVQREAVCAQTKVAVRVVLRIGHEPQVGQFATGVEVRNRLLCDLKSGRKHITGSHPKYVIQQRQRTRNAACRFQCAAKIPAFMGIADAQMTRDTRVVVCRKLLLI